MVDAAHSASNTPATPRFMSQAEWAATHAGDTNTADAAVKVSTRREPRPFQLDHQGGGADVAVALRHIAVNAHRASASPFTVPTGEAGATNSPLAIAALGSGLADAAAEAANTRASRHVIARSPVEIYTLGAGPNGRDESDGAALRLPRLDLPAEMAASGVLGEAARLSGISIRYANRDEKGDFSIVTVAGPGQFSVKAAKDITWKDPSRPDAEPQVIPLKLAGLERPEFAVTPTGSLRRWAATTVVEYSDFRQEEGVETADANRTRESQFLPPDMSRDERGIRIGARTETLADGSKLRIGGSDLDLTTRPVEDVDVKGTFEMNERDTARSRKRAPDERQVDSTPALTIRWNDPLNHRDGPPAPPGATPEEADRRAASALWLSLRTRVAGGDTEAQDTFNARAHRAATMKSRAGGQDWTLVMRSAPEAQVMREAMDWALDARTALRAQTQGRSAATTTRIPGRDQILDAFDGFQPPTKTGEKLTLGLLLPQKGDMSGALSWVERAKNAGATRAAAASRPGAPPRSPADFIQIALPPGEATGRLIAHLQEKDPVALKQIRVVGLKGDFSKAAEYEPGGSDRLIAAANQVVVFVGKHSATSNRFVADAARAGVLAEVQTPAGKALDLDAEVRHATSAHLSSAKYQKQQRTAATKAAADTVNDIRLTSADGRLLLGLVGLNNAQIDQVSTRYGAAMPPSEGKDMTAEPGTVGALREVAKHQSARSTAAALANETNAWDAGSGPANEAVQKFVQDTTNSFRRTPDGKAAARPDIAEVRSAVDEGLRALQSAGTIQGDRLGSVADRSVRRIAGDLGVQDENGRWVEKVERVALSSGPMDKLADDAAWANAAKSFDRISRDMVEFGLARLSTDDAADFRRMARTVSPNPIEALRIGLDPNRPIPIATDDKPGLTPTDAARFRSLSSQVDELRVHALAPAELPPALAAERKVIFVAGDKDLLNADRKVAILGDPAANLPASIASEVATTMRTAAAGVEAAGAVPVRVAGSGDAGQMPGRDILVLPSGHGMALRGQEKFDLQATLVEGGVAISTMPPVSDGIRESKTAMQALETYTHLQFAAGQHERSKSGPEVLPKALNDAENAAVATGVPRAAVRDMGQLARDGKLPTVTADVPIQVTEASASSTAAALRLAGRISDAVVLGNASLNSPVLPAVVEARTSGRRVLVPDGGLLDLTGTPARRDAMTSAFGGTLAMTIPGRQAADILPNIVDLRGLHGRPVATTYDPNVTPSSPTAPARTAPEVIVIRKAAPTRRASSER